MISREVNRYLGSSAAAQSIFRAIDRAIDGLGQVERRASKSQIGFYRQHPFAAVWKPGRYLEGDRPPLVLTVFLRRRDGSPRWKEIAETRPGRYSHHLELRAPGEVDDEVVTWLREAWGEAGQSGTQ